MSVAETRCNVLVCTLGATWAVVPEAFAFLAPESLDLYANHPQRDALDAARRERGLQAPDELWVLTTGGTRAGESLLQLHRWWTLAGRPVTLRIWQAQGTDHLATRAECEVLRELILRTVLGAKAHARGGQVVLSLAGGRKTMSADLQTAGSLFGSYAWLHVVGPDGQGPLAGAVGPETFVSPLAASVANGVTPLVVGRGVEDEAMQVPLDGRRLDAATFPLPLPGAGEVLSWALGEGEHSLVAEVDRRQREGSRLLGNFLAAVASQEQRENWRSLYRLPPKLIERLRATVVAPEHESFLQALPKADLHRHLGGAIGSDAQRDVGRAMWQSLSSAERNEAAARVAPLLESDAPWPWDWPDRLRGAGRPAAAAALLAHASPAQLQLALFGDTEPRVALKRSARGFAAYERPGELSGSALLSHPAAVEPYVASLVAQARAEGLTSVEIRGSPQKYRPDDPAGFVGDLAQALRRAGARIHAADAGDGPRVAFLWILDRRVTGGASATIDAAVRARGQWGDFLVGVDLAGDEDSSAPSDWEPLFGPVFRECLAVTIHAGEDAPAENKTSGRRPTCCTRNGSATGCRCTSIRA